MSTYTIAPEADLRHANLSGADLPKARLSNAILCYADLSNANLRGATLAGANASGADFTDAFGMPSSGPLRGWEIVDGFWVKKESK